MVGLAARDLSVRLGGDPVLDRVALDLAPGTVTAVIGANGAGKSTLLRALAGLVTAEGDLRLGGAPATRARLREAVAYMPQDTRASSSLTLTEVVLLGRLRALGLRVPADLVTEADHALARFGLAPLAHRTLDAVSGGQRQLALLAQALFRRPAVLLLDEPTAALDLRHQLMVLETVREAALADGIAVAIAMHDLTLAVQVAERFLCLRDGRVVAEGTGAEVLRRDHLRALYAVEADVIAGRDGRPIVVPLRALDP